MKNVVMSLFFVSIFLSFLGAFGADPADQRGERIALSCLQTVDIKLAFELVYAFALSSGGMSQIPRGFIACLEAVRRGEDSVLLSDFEEALPFLITMLLTLGKACDERENKGAYCPCNQRLDILEQDLFDIIDDLRIRIALLERIHGLY